MKKEKFRIRILSFQAHLKKDILDSWLHSQNTLFDTHIDIQTLDYVLPSNIYVCYRWHLWLVWHRRHSTLVSTRGDKNGEPWNQLKYKIFRYLKPREFICLGIFIYQKAYPLWFLTLIHLVRRQAETLLTVMVIFGKWKLTRRVMEKNLVQLQVPSWLHLSYASRKLRKNVSCINWRA